MSSRDSTNRISSKFINWCMERGMYYTAGLLGAVDFKVTDKIPAPAAVLVRKNTITVWVHKKYADHPTDLVNAFILHELRHVYQLAEIDRPASDWFDVTPITKGGCDPTSDRFKKLMQRIWNLAADIELNQDVVKYMSLHGYYTGVARQNNSPTDEEKEASFKKTAKWIRDNVISTEYTMDPKTLKFVDEDGEEIEATSGLMLPDSLQALVDKNPGWAGFKVENNRSLVYYGNIYIRLMADKYGQSLKKGDQIEQALDQILQDMENGEMGSNFDNHEFDELSDQELQDLADKARAATVKAAKEGKKLEYSAGRQAADGSEAVEGKIRAREEIKKLVQSLKVTASACNKKKYDVSKTWQRRNRKLPKLKVMPGIRKVVRPQPAVVCVLDTSGSMWEEGLLREMASCIQELHHRNKLAAAYCCDTEIKPMDTSKITKITFTGGGGTVFGAEQVNSIIEDLNVGKVEIIYMTDEAVWDLDSAINHPNARVRVINVPNLLLKGEA